MSDGRTVTYPAAMHARAVELYTAGLSLTEIGDMLGVDEATVRRRLLPADLPRRRRGPRGRTDVSDAELIRLREQGWSFVEIGKQVGMSRAGVSRRLLAAANGGTFRWGQKG